MGDNDNSGDYPQLDRRATLRVDADPAHIREEEVAHFRDFHKTDDALFISQAEMIEGVRFKYLGFPFEEAAKKQVPSMTDQHMKDNMYNAFKWKFPDYLCGKAVPKIYKTKEDCIKQNFISFQVGADFFVYNPLMLEVATDFVAEFSSADKWAVEDFPVAKGKPNKVNAKGTVGAAAAALANPYKKNVDEQCGNDPLHADCTAAITAFVTKAAKIMWDLYKVKRDSCVSHGASDLQFGCTGQINNFPDFPAAKKQTMMPFWSRYKTGKVSAQIGVAFEVVSESDPSAGLTVDRLYYKSNNQVGLSKMNDAIFKPRKTAGEGIGDNIHDLRMKRGCVVESKDLGEACTVQSEASWESDNPAPGQASYSAAVQKCPDVSIYPRDGDKEKMCKKSPGCHIVKKQVSAVKTSLICQKGSAISDLQQVGSAAPKEDFDSSFTDEDGDSDLQQISATLADIDAQISSNV